MREDAGRRQAHLHRCPLHLHHSLRQVHPCLDGTVIGQDEPLGGEGDLHPVKVVAVFELGHVGIVVGHAGQLPDLRQAALHHRRGKHRLLFFSAAGPPRQEARPSDQQRRHKQRAHLLQLTQRPPVLLTHHSSPSLSFRYLFFSVLCLRRRVNRSFSAKAGPPRIYRGGPGLLVLICSAPHRWPWQRSCRRPWPK